MRWLTGAIVPSGIICLLMLQIAHLPHTDVIALLRKLEHAFRQMSYAKTITHHAHLDISVQFVPATATTPIVGPYEGGTAKRRVLSCKSRHKFDITS